MNDVAKSIRPTDVRFYNQNRTGIPPEDLLQYAGQWLAWSADGKRILAHGREYDAVVSDLRAAGISTSEVVWEEMPALHEDGQVL